MVGSHLRTGSLKEPFGCAFGKKTANRPFHEAVMMALLCLKDGSERDMRVLNRAKETGHLEVKVGPAG